MSIGPDMQFCTIHSGKADPDRDGVTYSAAALPVDGGNVTATTMNSYTMQDDSMESKYYENWHLAKSNREYLVTEFEWSTIRFYEAFMRWVTTTGSVLTDADIKFSEHLILHVIRMQNRPKSGAIIARMINRDDLPNVQYSLRKLESAKLIEKVKEGSGKTFSYTVTDLGKKVTDGYSQIRSEFLINSISTISDVDVKIEEIIKMMGVLTGIYEEMARNSATFSSQY